MMKKGLMIMFLMTAILAGAAAADAANPKVLFDTAFGKFTVELYPEKAPKTVENFTKYVNDSFFDGLIYHRVIGNFMVQGGGFTPDMTQKTPTHGQIQNEADNGLKNKRGTLAMARTSDPHSASSQFFINVVDNEFLNHSGKTPQGWGYCVFGAVTEGMDVVDKIKAVKTGHKNGHGDVPLEPVVMKSVKMIEDKATPATEPKAEETK